MALRLLVTSGRRRQQGEVVGDGAGADFGVVDVQPVGELGASTVRSGRTRKPWKSRKAL
jgi:hypothetical protein